MAFVSQSPTFSLLFALRHSLEAVHVAVLIRVVTNNLAVIIDRKYKGERGLGHIERNIFALLQQKTVGQEVVTVVESISVDANDVSSFIDPTQSATGGARAGKVDDLKITCLVSDVAVNPAVSVGTEITNCNLAVIHEHPDVRRTGMQWRDGFWNAHVVEDSILQDEAVLIPGAVEMPPGDVAGIVNSASRG